MQSRKRRSSRAAKPAHEAAAALLARRAHSTAELRSKLALRGYDADEISATVLSLERSGYLDDESYSAGLARRRLGSRGSVAIRAELAAKGVAREVASAVVSEISPEAEAEAAWGLANRIGASDPTALARKLTARGFSGTAVREVLNRLRRGDAVAPATRGVEGE